MTAGQLPLPAARGPSGAPSQSSSARRSGRQGVSAIRRPWGPRALLLTRRTSFCLLAVGNGEDVPYVPSAPDPSLVQCPHCGRRFNENAAARHIPICTSIKNKPTMLVKGTGGNAVTRRR